jgi:hypothetical protein
MKIKPVLMPGIQHCADNMCSDQAGAKVRYYGLAAKDESVKLRLVTAIR